MSLLASVGAVLARLERSVEGSHLLQVADSSAILMLSVVRMHHTAPPATPLAREEWEMYATPLMRQAERIKASVYGRNGPVGPRGKAWDWSPMCAVLTALINALRSPGLDDLYTAVPATVPPTAGGGVVGAKPSLN